MPEDALRDVVPHDHLANVLTLGMSLNYQRHAYALWKAIALTFDDPATQWIFEPSAVAAHDVGPLRTALLQHRVGLQPNRHPDIWHRVALGIVQSSPRRDVLGLVGSAHFDVVTLRCIMQGTRKPEFPYLSGPKIFNYWLYVLERYAGIGVASP